ncbi:bifunctional tRNA (5-methylaminomethyl-2-thiouridine)(34)-methyltransferase MnmD/FAD-dependent 5-carboxymethylaminomethyl-2-thiouridine(34) oxidoreductase MnmC [Marinobacter salinexigens]|uniref:tRNA 5-methylaminomethyl-2-thiouridine biosynthesis bifunctional protein MnmC n=1 Tax=Marinobacter salinexigens TaxID=2919747 RepID=A0A5B0VI39_9GAMM|nr:bifunctional tRNA (5-methylaminomethyl-2-thiouridine)(34)-methyltransferase MnmD/FAD-dependent 5-carboxymethylaminomethyl-2-thiouridine(34) oxidoreductase MnmC [Marinobacter salinexigens]KAA1173923.1 bifunctional tRNA (5-methylaminomethyl-2-thiouridine)(34)-methyltransferase MnmD/FAD-dependent 5-carboxymethylaminomethyl-2-thiouridine(34) oxidoreductase MnmC [Marinobacter salinexigens]
MAQQVLKPGIEPADLVWNDGVPESTRFGDVYFSRDNGLEETRYVFLDRNRLRERFQAVEDGGHFVIAETGFGTGLNFLATWELWQEVVADKSAILHFVSVERFPLTPEDLARALESWPTLAPFAEELRANYPPLTHGVHRIHLAGGRIRLTLYFGDILDAWSELSFCADAWFLDGFAPSLNPEMWLDQAIGHIRSHSKAGTTLATFTAVGRIRRALADSGFTMQKTAGFGRKRDMLIGELEDPAQTPDTGIKESHPAITIIGAGISGCLLARNLADRGVPVTLIEAADDAGSAASGNRQGALYVKLGVEFNDQTELALTALTFSQRAYKPYEGRFWHPTGLLQLACDDKEAERQQRFLERSHYPESLLRPVDSMQASELCGIATQHSGLWFPGCGWLEPAKACTLLAEHPLIQKRYGVQVEMLSRHRERWHISASDGSTFESETLVLCTGHTTPDLLPFSGNIRLKRIRGQVTHIPSNDLNNPDCVVCGHRYLNPVSDEYAVTGATFDLRDDNPDVTLESHRENLDELNQMLPGVGAAHLLEGLTLNDLTGRVAFRCTTHDYQPVAGPCDIGSDHSGLYLFTGLGSKGLTYAPLLAEYLGDRLTGQPSCLPLKLQRRVDANRILR